MDRLGYDFRQVSARCSYLEVHALGDAVGVGLHRRARSNVARQALPIPQREALCRTGDRELDRA